MSAFRIISALLGIIIFSSAAKIDAGNSSILKCRVNGTAVCGVICTGVGIRNNHLTLKIDTMARTLDLNGIHGTYELTAEASDYHVRNVSWQFDLIRLDHLRFVDDPRFRIVSLVDAVGSGTPLGGREIEFMCH